MLGNVIRAVTTKMHLCRAHFDKIFFKYTCCGRELKLNFIYEYIYAYEYHIHKYRLINVIVLVCNYI